MWVDPWFLDSQNVVYLWICFLQKVNLGLILAVVDVVLYDGQTLDVLHRDISRSSVSSSPSPPRGSWELFPKDRVFWPEAFPA